MNNNTVNFDETMPPSRKGGDANALKPGKMLGQYKVVRLLGRGGMGEVYEVEHTTLRRHYALKLLPADFANRSDALARFKREAEVMANLEHPHIVKVDDFGEAGGRYWLRMELANGHNGAVSLQDYADKHGGQIEPDILADIFEQVLDGLAYAHKHGVVHRDLKPANILIFEDKDGYATFKIADFGLVRMIGEEWLQSRTEQSIRLSMSVGGMPAELPEGAGTSTRSLVGTYEYMAPEQKRGEEATPASDVYSVGLMMYRLLTGRQLGMKRPSEIVNGLPDWWDGLVAASLEEDAGERFANAAAMRETLLGTDTNPSKAAREDTRAPDNPTEQNELGMEFVEIAPGSFKMGSNDGDDEPIHDVRISHRFWLGKYEVTNSEYQRFVKESGYDGKADSDDDYMRHHRDWSKYASTSGSYPIVCVSWKNATAFCNWLTELESRAGRLLDGYVYRLPTEAEWEYAARGGTKSQGYKYAGSDNADEVAWYYENAGDQRLDDANWDLDSAVSNNNLTHEVGTKKANELGLHDMSGNVWEWCYDWYSEDYYGKSPETNPVNTAAASNRVGRGGCWIDSSWGVRSARRYGFGPDDTFGSLGFRVCLAPQIRA